MNAIARSGRHPKRAISYFDLSNTRIRRQGYQGLTNLRQRAWVKEVLCYVAIFFVFALFYVTTRVQVTETGYRLRRQTEEGEKLKEIQHSLQVEVATLKSPQMLEQKAAQLGLSKPLERQVVILSRRERGESGAGELGGHD